MQNEKASYLLIWVLLKEEEKQVQDQLESVESQIENINCEKVGKHMQQLRLWEGRKQKVDQN